MKKHTLIFLLISLIVSIALFVPEVSAESDYVLPYPSAMPGSVFYKLNLIKEKVLKYWYFGNIGQFTYNLKQSDKYLVQAKTLFEYKQYLLGYEALKKSNIYFKNSPQFLAKAKKESKNIERQQKILKEAGLKHIEVLEKAKREVPETFVWQPEKLSPITLNLKKSIEKSIAMRNKAITHFFERPPPRLPERVPRM